MIYLDNAATTHKKPSGVYNAVLEELKNSANPGRGSHSLSIRAFNKIYETREELASLFKINHPENFILTPNATYALNFAIKGLLKENDHCITTVMEHNSVLRPLHSIKNIEVSYVKSDKWGFISPEGVKKCIKDNTRLIIINHSSNVNGIIQDIESVAKIIAPYKIPVLIDASQSAGILDIDWSLFSMIAFAGHKSLYGPQGTGGLYVASEITLDTVIEGGTGNNSKILSNPNEYPEKLESGTLNTPGFAGLLEGIKFIKSEGINTILEYEHFLITDLLNALFNIKGVSVYSPYNIKRLTNTICFNINNMDSAVVADILNRKYNIAVRPGYHCAYKAHKNIGTSNTGAVRVSVSYFNTQKEISVLKDAVNAIAKGSF